MQGKIAHSNPKSVYHIYSDFCLEDYDNYPLIRSNNVHGGAFHSQFFHICVLAGNIGHPKNKNYWDFLKHCSLVYDTTLIVLGTFECKGSTLAYTTDFVREETQKKFKNVFLIHNEGIKLRDGMIVVGTPGWSKDIVHNQIQGYTINVARSQERVAKSVIKEGLNQYKDKGIIIITSSPPCFSEKELKDFPRTFWIHGENGCNGVKTINRVQLISNQNLFFGSEHRSFNPNFVFSM